MDLLNGITKLELQQAQEARMLSQAFVKKRKRAEVLAAQGAFDGTVNGPIFVTQFVTRVCEMGIFGKTRDERPVL
jgi:hypothetical protein